MQREGRGSGFGWKGADEATCPDTGKVVGRRLGTARLWVGRLATRMQGTVGTPLPSSWRGRTGERGSWLPRRRTSGGRRGRGMGSNVGSCTPVDHLQQEG